jgi:O-antigen/teichoic acid export membrane protein
MLIALVKIGGPSSAGQFTLALAICGPVFVFASLQLRAIQATDTETAYLLQDYLGLRVGTIFLALLAVAFIAVEFGNRGSALFIVIAIGCLKALEAASDLLFGYLQKHERMDCVATSLILKGLVSVVAVWLGYLIWHDLLAVVFLLCCVSAAILLSFDLANCVKMRRLYRDDATRFRPRFCLRKLKCMSALLAPAGFSTMLTSLIANVPRYAVEQYAGKHILGLFGGLYYIQAALVTLAAGVGQASGPRLARHHSAGDKQKFVWLLFRLLGAMGIAGILVSVGVYFLGAPTLASLYTPEYAKYNAELFMLMLAAAVSMLAAVLNDSVLAMRQLRQQVFVFLLTLVFTVIGCNYAVKRYGLRGAAWAVLLSSAIQLGATAILVSVHLRRPWRGMTH